MSSKKLLRNGKKIEGFSFHNLRKEEKSTRPAPFSEIKNGK